MNDDTTSGAGPRAGQSAGAPRQIAVRANCIESGDLFEAGREVLIAHGADTYRLRLTSQNKLILTK